ncbi:MAG: response regulator [Armatimonadia bacterium]|nr:response regulator [Armatimonadia bacterium]
MIKITDDTCRETNWAKQHIAETTGGRGTMVVAKSVGRRGPRREQAARMQVTMIEDDREDAMIFEDTLRYETDIEADLEVFSTLSGGLEHLMLRGADILFLDLRLPDSTGLSTLKRVLDAAPELPVVVLTGMSDPDLALGAVNAGAQDYLVKSEFDGQLIARTARYAIERHRLKRELENHAEALEESEARFRAMIEQNADAIVAINDDGLIVFANRAAEDMFGRTPGELVGQPFGVPLVSEDGSEVELLQGESGPVTVEMRVSETPWHGEKVQLVSMRDVTERKQAALALRKANRRLAEAMDELKETQRRVIQQERLRALGEMASGIAHDFNNVLSPILGFSEIMLGDEQEDLDVDRIHRLAGYINTAARDARSTVARLREFYRHKEDIETLCQVDLNEIVVEAVELTRPKWRDQAQARGIEMTVQTETEEVETLLGDASELREVAVNLILNAVDAMPDGGTVRVFTRQLGAQVAFGVEDEGVGMDDSTVRRCMDPMFTTKGSDGTGMGLAVSYGIVRRHNGEIHIESELEQGTKITCVLPLAQEDARQVDSDEQQMATEPLDVLLVDDDESVRNVVLALLEDMGHAVDGVGSAPEALDLVAEREYDVMITDRAMPGMNGDELALAVTEHNPALPVILLTGFGDMMKHAGESPAGVDLIVSKPVGRSELHRALCTMSRRAAGAAVPAAPDEEA